MTLHEKIELKLVRFAVNFGKDPVEGDPRKAADEIIDLARSAVAEEKKP